MTRCVSLFILFVTLKITLGTENADDFRKETGASDSEPQVNSRYRDFMERGFTDQKCTDARECLTNNLKENPITLLKLNKLFPLKSQGRLLEEDFLKNGTRAGDIFSQNKLEQLYQKALQGQDINVAVIGGSNTAGGSFDQDEKGLEGIFYNLFAKWWNATLGDWTGSYMRIHSAGISGLGSYLFAFCYDSFLPVGLDIDLIILERSVNFQGRYKSAPLETLTRQIIKRTPSSIISYVNLVSGLGKNPRTQKFGNPHCHNLENYGQLDVARRYNIVSFCVKDLLCKKITGGNYEIREEITRISKVIASDLAHVGALTHAQVGLMIINYFRYVFDKITENKLTFLGDSDQKIAPLLMRAPIYNVSDKETLKNPQCWLTLTPDVCRRNAQHPSLDVRIEKYKGFRFYNAFVQKPPLNCNGKFRKDLQRGWGSWRNNSFMRFRIFVNPWNLGSAERSRSVIIVLRAGQRIGGKALVWLDKEKKAAVRVHNIVPFVIFCSQ